MTKYPIYFAAKDGGHIQTQFLETNCCLDSTYIFFWKMVYVRLRGCLDSHQSIDRTGFRTGTAIDDAFVGFEMLCSRNLEWNAPLWFANLDLPTGFDRVEYVPLLNALIEQGVPKPYCALLWALCQQQNLFFP